MHACTSVAHTSLKVRNRVRFSCEIQTMLHKLGYPRAFDHWEVCDILDGSQEVVLKPPNRSHAFLTFPLNSAVFSPGIL